MQDFLGISLASNEEQGFDYNKLRKPWMNSKELILGTTENISQAVDECLASGHYGLDLETSGLDHRIFDGRTKDYIVGFCISPDGNKGYYFPVMHDPDKFRQYNIPEHIWRPAMLHLTNSSAVARLHNGKFDQVFLEHNGGEPLGDWDDPAKWDDSEILAYLRNNKSRSKELKELAKASPKAVFSDQCGGPGLGMEMIELYELFGHTKKKKDFKYDFSKLDPSNPACVWYGCSDAICTFLLVDLLSPSVHVPDSDGKTQSGIYKIEKMCVAATRWMEGNRIYIPRHKVEELVRLGQQEWFDSVMEVYAEAEKHLGRDAMPRYFKILQPDFVADNPNKLIDQQIEEAERKAADEEAQAKWGMASVVSGAATDTHGDKISRNGKEWPYTYDVGSASQLGVLFEELGIEGLNYTEKSGQVKTSKAEIERILEDYGDQYPFLSKIRRFRETQKALSTYLYPLLDEVEPSDNTVQVAFRAFKTDTGRFSTPSRDMDMGAKRVRRPGWPHLNIHSIPATYDPKKPECMLRLRETIGARQDRFVVACVAEGSLVSTLQGLVPIEQVQPGDKVLTEQNGYAPVQARQDNGLRDVVRITTSKGFTLTVTPDHLIRVVDQTGYAWKQAKDLQPTDWLVQKWAYESSQDGPVLPAPKEKDHRLTYTHSAPERLTEKLAEFLGRFMGDGCLMSKQGKPQKICISLGKDDTELLPFLNEQAAELFGVQFKERGRGDVYYEGKLLASWMREITGKENTRHMSMPKTILNAPKPMQAAFLRGLFDADGYVGRRQGDGLVLCVTSEAFARSTHLMLLELGIQARIKPIKTVTNFGPYEGFWISVQGNDNLAVFKDRVGFVTKRKQERLPYIKGNRDISDFVPYSLVPAAVPRQRHKETNRVHSNSRRRWRCSRQLLAATKVCPEGINLPALEKLLDRSTLFDTVVSVVPAGIARVFDLSVPDGSNFQAGGFIVHNCDFSGVELRIITNLSREPKWVTEFFRCSDCDHTFDRGEPDSTPEAPPSFCPNCGSDKIGDLHSLTALEVFGKDSRKKPEWKQLRQKAKSTNFALCYGGGGKAVQRATSCDENEGMRIKKQFDSTFRDLKSWWTYQHDFVQKHGFVRTAFGRKCPAPDIFGTDEFFKAKAKRNAVNAPIQGSSADITKIAMALVYKECKKRGWLEKCRMIITMHDELVFEVDGDILHEACEVLPPLMNRNKAVLGLKWPVPLTSDIEIGHDWTVPWNYKVMSKGMTRYIGNKEIKSKEKLPEGVEWNHLPSYPEVLFPYFKDLYPGYGPPPEGTVINVPVEEKPVVKLPADNNGTPPKANGNGAAPKTNGSTPKTNGSTHTPPSTEVIEPAVNEGVFEYKLHAPLTITTAMRLARLVVRCQNKGTSRLRLLSPQGEDLDAWRDVFGHAPVKVNAQTFLVLAKEEGL